MPLSKWSRMIRPRESASSTASGSAMRSSAVSLIGSPMASASMTAPTAAGNAPMRDSISSTRPHGMIGSPIHCQKPCSFVSRPSATSCSTMWRRYRTLPRASSQRRLGGVRVHRSAQCGRQQRGGLVGRQRLQIEPLELAGLPQFLCPSGNRFTVAHREHYFRGAPLDDLMHDECRQVIEQVHVIDTDHHRRARRGRSQRLDHPADQLNGVGAI